MAIVNSTEEEFKNEDIRKSIARLVKILDLDPDSKTLFHLKSNPELTTVRIPIQRDTSISLHSNTLPLGVADKCAVFEMRYDYDKFLGYQFSGWHFKEITNI